jgi:hypothetical protein
VSKVAGWRQLGRGQEGSELSEGYSAHVSHPFGRLADALTVVDGHHNTPAQYTTIHHNTPQYTTIHHNIPQ